MTALRLSFEKPYKVAPAKAVGLAEMGATAFLSLMVPFLDIVQWPEPYRYTGGLCESRRLRSAKTEVKDFENTIKKKYSQRIAWIGTLPDGWDGFKAEAIHQASLENVRSVIETIHSLRLVNWNLFPAANGTVLMTLKKRAIATINVADNNFSFVAATMTGKSLIQGKENMSVDRIIEVMSEIEATFDHA